jgi:hypothetical protein
LAQWRLFHLEEPSAEMVFSVGPPQQRQGCSVFTFFSREALLGVFFFMWAYFSQFVFPEDGEAAVGASGVYPISAVHDHIDFRFLVRLVVIGPARAGFGFASPQDVRGDVLISLRGFAIAEDAGIHRGSSFTTSRHSLGAIFLSPEPDR